MGCFPGVEPCGNAVVKYAHLVAGCVAAANVTAVLNIRSDIEFSCIEAYDIVEDLQKLDELVECT